MRQKPNDYERAEELFRDAELKEERGDFRGAFKNLSMAVRLGHVSSQINLGNFYANGKGVRKDFKEAARWYKKAYLSGRSAGAVNLSVDLQRQGNMRGAIAWLKRAAAMNDGDACVQLARLYMARRGGAKTAAALLKTALSLNRSETSDEAREQAQNMLKSMTTLL